MEIKDCQVTEITVVSLAGSIDSLTAQQISAHMDALIAGGVNKIVADFSQVDYTSSAGLRVILLAAKAARGNGGDFYLAAVQKQVEKVLSLTGFSSIIKLFPDVDSAIKSF